MVYSLAWVHQGWHLPTMLGYKWGVKWENVLNPLGQLFPKPPETCTRLCSDWLCVSICMILAH